VVLRLLSESVGGVVRFEATDRKINNMVDTAYVPCRIDLSLLAQMY